MPGGGLQIRVDNLKTFYAAKKYERNFLKTTAISPICRKEQGNKEWRTQGPM